MLSIAGKLAVEARSPFGPAMHLPDLEPYATQKAVCFTETPLEHTWMMLKELENPRRQVEFMPYGLAITKTTARRAGCNPVWYTDQTPGTGHDWLVRSVNDLISQARNVATNTDGSFDSMRFMQDPIFKLTPFFEQMGSRRWSPCEPGVLLWCSDVAYRTARTELNKHGEPHATVEPTLLAR